jgi:hypothetical protein
MQKVKEIFKKYLIPHEGNDHQPHLLRRQAVAFVCLVVFGAQFALLFYSAYIIPRSSVLGAIFANTLVDETNQNRVANNISALTINPLLVRAAQEKADDMVKNNYFAHTSPAGVTPWQWFADVGYNFTSAGENLAVNFSDSVDVTNAWMNSPEHRANILNSGFAQIGIATAEGTYDGKPAIYVVELFGTPAVPVATVNVPTPTRSAPLARAVSKPIAPASIPAQSAVQGVATTVAAVTTSVVALAPVTVTKTEPMVNSVVAAVAAPRQTVNYIYLFIIGLFLAALFFNIFIKIRIQHPNVIFGGVLVIAVAGLCIMLGQYVTLAHAMIL